MVDKVGHVAQVTDLYRSQAKGQAQPPARTDSVEISSAGRAASLHHAVATAVQNASEIRQDRVKEAREKLERGEYLTDKVIQKVAEKIADAIVGTKP